MLLETGIQAGIAMLPVIGNRMKTVGTEFVSQEVVVGAKPQTRDPVQVMVVGGEEDNRQQRTALPQRLTQLESGIALGPRG